MSSNGVLDYGYVKLVGHTVDFQDLDSVRDYSPGSGELYLDTMPEDLTLDAQIARSARVSYRKGTTQVSSDDVLIDYLMRHQHTSPFEQVSFKFEIKLPLFVAQQLIRHRTAKLNQESARYSEMHEEFYWPDAWRSQDEVNKQGSVAGTMDEAHELLLTQDLQAANASAYHTYRSFLNNGVAREMARMVLPVNTYTTMVWQMDLHNLMHFLKLRLDEHAQWEIRQYAQALHDLVQPLVPITFASFENHVLQAVTFSGDEMALIRDALAFYVGADNLDEDIKEEFPGLPASRRREFIAKIGPL